MKAKRYYLSYTDLVINTMIDALKFEDRRVIDDKDIYSYTQNSRQLFQQKDVNVVFLGNEDYDGFLSKIQDFLCIYDDKYILLPWVEKEDLISNFRGAIPIDVISIIANKNRSSFLSERSKKDLKKYEEINNFVVSKYLNEVSNNVENLEKELLEENKKLSKIRKYVGYSDGKNRRS